MPDEKQYNKMANKLINLEDKFIEMKPVIKIIDMWVKDKDYELIPIINMLNDKMNEVEKYFRA